MKRFMLIPTVTGRVLLAAIAIAVVVPALAFSLTPADSDEILRRIDDLQNFPDVDFTSVLTFVVEDPEEGVDRQVIQQFRRDSEDKFLLLIREPLVQLGQGYLRVDDVLWFYDPESRQFNRTSLREEFSDSNARNSDFGASSLSDDYVVTAVEEGTLGRFQVFVLDLEATNDEVTYPRQRMWITRNQYLPLKVEEYSGSARLLRTSYYPSYARVGDQFIATELIFVDELVAGRKTQISLTEISTATLPDSVFTKAYVERVSR